MRKPEREIYELTCSRMGIAPTEAIFVDDNADNVAAARAYGMEAVHFQENPVGGDAAPRRDSRPARHPPGAGDRPQIAALVITRR